MSLPQIQTPVEFDDALRDAQARALATYPQAEARIHKGLALLQADAVTDCCHLEARWWTVRSQTRPDALYNVRSHGVTTCTCTDYDRHADDPDYACKHIFAVWLLRKAKQTWHPKPRLRNAYHMQSGEEGHARKLSDGRAVFHPGGHKYSFICAANELCFGSYLGTTGRPF